ncbi:RING-type E3 ubiquitin transferase [Trifolium repens]|nr:RING-type E3 ubiquitin transferase [Trifolium repens]
MQETTFVSLFSKCNVRKDAFKLVFDQICKCANDMLSGEYEDLSVLTIRVDLVVTRPDDEEEEEEEMEVEAQDEVSELVPAISRAMKAKRTCVWKKKKKKKLMSWFLLGLLKVKVMKSRWTVLSFMSVLMMGVVAKMRLPYHETNVKSISRGKAIMILTDTFFWLIFFKG